MARIHDSVACAGCGEPTMQTRIRRLEGKGFCPACFEAALSYQSTRQGSVEST